MQEQRIPIFRSEVWRRYLTRQEATVFPRLAMPRNLALLWLVPALILAGSMMILSIEAPVYGSGVAVAIAKRGNAEAEVIIAVLGQGEQSRPFQTGEAVIVELDEKRPPVVGLIIEVEETPIGLSEAVARFNAPADAFSTIRFPASVVFARITGDWGNTISPSDRPGDQNAVYQARVQCGKRRAISYVIPATTQE